MHLENTLPTKRTTLETLLCCWLVLAASHLATAEATKSDPQTAPEGTEGVRFDPVVKQIEGWTVYVDPQMLAGEHSCSRRRRPRRTRVYVDPQMLAGEHSEAGARALRMLASHLQRIAILVPEDRLAKLRKLEIWIDYSNPRLGGKHYHPNRDWLVAHGLDPRLAKKVHITHAASLLSRQQLLKHPAVVLHELAHAYHEQFLGYDDPRIIEAYQKAKESGSYEKVLLYDGSKVRHYAMKNHKEYFAEATEAYFYRNDFYPFVRAELKEHDPGLYDLLVEIWGP